MVSARLPGAPSEDSLRSSGFSQSLSFRKGEWEKSAKKVTVCAGVSLSLVCISGPVSCACCADNQCLSSAGSVQQEQGPGLANIIP
ncbi:hypothetical protein PDJAM_G00046710 [Pangasius djambal]|uniref:Uncharacterized protein n=1 Tax=Pangasius djambal TaxID=1691987 RepID=A0ACC5YVP3_9TELE|nr:hypothetical protein [Pangasius djambal]